MAVTSFPSNYTVFQLFINNHTMAHSDSEDEGMDDLEFDGEDDGDMDDENDPADDATEDGDGDEVR